MLSCYFFRKILLFNPRFHCIISSEIDLTSGSGRQPKEMSMIHISLYAHNQKRDKKFPMTAAEERKKKIKDNLKLSINIT